MTATTVAAARRLLGLGAARGAASLTGFLGVVLVARLLPPAELGAWSLALAAQGYALHLGELGLRSVVTTELAGTGSAWPVLLRRYLAWRCTLSLAAIGLTLLATLVLAPASLGLVALTTLAILPIALQLDWIALVDDRLALAAQPLLARPLAFALLVACLPAASAPFQVAACYLAAWCLAALLSWPALRRPPLPPPRQAPPDARHLLGRGLPLMLVTLTNQAQLSLDLLAVGWALGAAEAGDYFLASQIAVAALLFANTANQVALARLPALLDRPLRLVQELRADLRHLLAAALLLALLLALLAPPLLPRLLGAEHAGAAVALLWLLPWLVLQHLTTLLQGALTAMRRERTVLRANLGLLLALLLALPLAAAWGTLAAFALARTAAELVRLTALLCRLDLGTASRPACND
ncbi:MAG: oligosaccharide flippase family protein [Geminicoccaceae bacterium]